MRQSTRFALVVTVAALLPSCAHPAAGPRDVAAERQLVAARYADSDVFRAGTDRGTPVLFARQRRDRKAERLAAAYPLDYPRPVRVIRLLYLRAPDKVTVERVDWSAAQERLDPVSGDAIRHGRLLLLGDGGGLWVYDLRRRQLRRIVTLAKRPVGPMTAIPHYAPPIVRWSDDPSTPPRTAYVAVAPRTLRWRLR